MRVNQLYQPGAVHHHLVIPTTLHQQQIEMLTTQTDVEKSLDDTDINNPEAIIANANDFSQEEVKKSRKPLIIVSVVAIVVIIILAIVLPVELTDKKRKPTANPTVQPSIEPSAEPSFVPTAFPFHLPTSKPSFNPSSIPTCLPTIELTNFHLFSQH